MDEPLSFQGGHLTVRRELMNLLAESPYVALGGVATFFVMRAFAGGSSSSHIIRHPEDALSVLDFEDAAKRKLPNVLWSHLATGVECDGTLRANREGYQHIRLRPRRLRDVIPVDTHVELFGTVYDSPIFLCPTA